MTQSAPSFLYYTQGAFSRKPSVFVTAAHHHSGLKRDASSVWLENNTKSSVQICLRELQNYAGSHEDIYVVSLILSSNDGALSILNQTNGYKLAHVDLSDYKSRK